MLVFSHCYYNNAPSTLRLTLHSGVWKQTIISYIHALTLDKRISRVNNIIKNHKDRSEFRFYKVIMM